MSDAYLRFVPTEPTFRPAASAAEAAEQLLSSFLPGAEAIRSSFSDHVQFVDPGANWSGVRCPVCGVDAEAWWSDAMDVAAKTHFEDLMTISVCCRAPVSLNDLQYVWPSAFGRYVLEAMNPTARVLPAKQLRDLEESLGCRLRQVAVHL
jgi:hypothetical protein